MSHHPIQHLSTGHHHRATGWELASHFHPNHELIVVTKGAQYVGFDSQQVLAGTGDALLYPAGFHHREWSRPDVILESYFCSFHHPGITATTLQRAHDSRGRMRQIISWLHSDRGRRDPQAASERDTLVTVLISEFLRQLVAQEPTWLDEVRRYVRRHIAATLSLDDLAAVAGMSKFHFVRQFRAATGSTPMEQVRQLRADYARELILTTSLSFKEIAPLAGLGTQPAMCRLFRQLYATTPGHLRRFSTTAAKPSTAGGKQRDMTPDV